MNDYIAKLKSIVLILLFPFLQVSVYSQTSLIEGKVIDYNGEGVPFISVRLKENNSIITNVITDFNGTFKITAPLKILDSTALQFIEKSYCNFDSTIYFPLISDSNFIVIKTKLNTPYKTSQDDCPFHSIQCDIYLIHDTSLIVNYHIPLIDMNGGKSSSRKRIRLFFEKEKEQESLPPSSPPIKSKTIDMTPVTFKNSCNRAKWYCKTHDSQY